MEQLFWKIINFVLQSHSKKIEFIDTVEKF